MNDRGRRGPVSIACVLVAVFLALAGCSPRPDLSGRVQEISDVLSALPGVDDVDHYYQNQEEQLGFDGARQLYFEVRIASEASDDEIIGVASTFISEVADAFDDYDRELVLRMPDFTVDINGTPDPDRLRQRLSGMKEQSPILAAETFKWGVRNDDDSGDVLTIGDTSATPDAVLTAARSLVGSEQVMVKASPRGGARWEVRFPYSAEAQNRLFAALGQGVPDGVDMIAISDDQVEYVSVSLDSGTDATMRLKTVIDTIAAGTPPPWTLSWRVPEAKPNPHNLATGSTVSVGGCEYNPVADHASDPAEHFTPDAIAVRDELRAQYDTCV